MHQRQRGRMKKGGILTSSSSNFRAVFSSMPPPFAAAVPNALKIINRYSGRTKYSARTKYSVPAYHLCNNAKKTYISRIFFWKIKKQEFARRILRKKSVVLPLKLLNKHFSKMTFFSLIQMLPVVYCGRGKFSPTVKPNSGSCLKSQPMFPFP